MQDIHFIAVESFNFARSGVFDDIILSAHRFMTVNPQSKIQLSFPSLSTDGHNKGLGRRCVIFGVKQDLEKFWELNGDDIEQTCALLSPSGIAVRSLSKLVNNQPDAIGGYGIFARYRIRSQAKLIEEKVSFLKSKGLSVDIAEIKARIDQRIKDAPKTIETMDYFSKTDKKQVKINIAFKSVDTKEHSIDESSISTFGLSTTNIVPILKL